jgi:hypothetical protein
MTVQASLIWAQIEQKTKVRVRLVDGPERALEHFHTSRGPTIRLRGRRSLKFSATSIPGYLDVHVRAVPHVRAWHRVHPVAFLAASAGEAAAFTSAARAGTASILDPLQPVRIGVGDSSSEGLIFSNLLLGGHDGFQPHGRRDHRRMLLEPRAGRVSSTRLRRCSPFAAD